MARAPCKSPETPISPVCVILPQPAHVMKPAPATKSTHETKLEIVTDPFVPDAGRGQPDEDRQAGPENRPRPRLRSDADQDSAMPHREGTGALTRRFWCMKTSWGRSVNLETGREEIEVLDAGELAVERFSQRPAP